MTPAKALTIPRRSFRVGHWGNAVPTNLVNLDALIPREDFEIREDAVRFEQRDRITINDLNPGFFYNALRKPDFQRETSGWNAAKIADLVTSYLSGDLIPAVILWQPENGGSIFVIDGAHRLSALIAWVRDDYGDGDASRAFFKNQLPQEQLTAAERTRKLVKGTVGSFAEHLAATQYPEQSRPEVRARARRLGTLAVIVQWVNGNANKAEQSFFKINQEATPIDPTELRILRSRKHPNALAARAIMRAGTGHRYWEQFTEEYQKGIETLAAEIHRILFSPPLVTPIKTLDLPVAGRSYSALTLPLIYDLVNLANGETPLTPAEKAKTPKKGEKAKETPKPDLTDPDGQKTIRYLAKVRATVQRISGTHSSSLGLHPAIYFYSTMGRHQPTAFLAVVGFIMELERREQLKVFAQHREKFEDFLLAQKDMVNQIVRRFGGGLKPFYRLKNFYHFVYDAIKAGKAGAQILNELGAHPVFAFVKALPAYDEETERQDFKTSVKSAAFLRAALEAPRERCAICHARLHVNSISLDHIVRKADGGIGTLDNSQLAHPYCDSTLKN